MTAAKACLQPVTKRPTLGRKPVTQSRNQQNKADGEYSQAIKYYKQAVELNGLTPRVAG